MGMGRRGRCSWLVGSGCFSGQEQAVSFVHHGVNNKTPPATTDSTGGPQDDYAIPACGCAIRDPHGETLFLRRHHGGADSSGGWQEVSWMLQVPQVSTHDGL